MARDTVGTDTIDGIEASNFPFIIQREPTDILVTSGTNSGILGLSPENDASGPLFVSALHDQGAIKANTFSILLSFQPFQDSYLTFGGVPEFVEALDNDFVCHRISGSFHWQLKVPSMEFDGEEFAFEKTPTLMLTDTGTTMTYLPYKGYEWLIKKICEDVECVNIEVEHNVVSSLVYVRNCELDNFKPLWFRIDTHWYMLAPNSYLIFSY